MSYNEPDNYDDTIDVDDLEARIADLQSRIDDEDDELSSAETDEFSALLTVSEQVEGFDGPMIRDSYFKDYCRELVTDCGYLPDDLPAFIENNIDWEGVADDLSVDYTEVDFDGVTYLIR